MNRLFQRAPAAALALALVCPALAQTYRDSGGTAVQGVVPIAPGIGPMGTAANPEFVQGSLSQSVGGFNPTPSYSQLSVGALSARVALPAGTVVIVYNTGSTDAFVVLGGASVVATTNADVIKAGCWMGFTVGSDTYLAGIETTGATSLNISGGAGLPTGGCAGTGSGGSVPTGAAGTPNAAVVSVQGVSGGTVIPENQTQLGGASLGAATAWGTAPSGNVQGVNANIVSGAGAVKAASTAAGASDPSQVVALSPNSPTPAGTNIIGQAGIDQTTDGTTNAVHLKAGTAIAGKFGIDQTTDGTTNKVAPEAPMGAASLATGQVSVGTTVGGTLIAAARTGVPGTGRASVTIVNTTTTAIYLGNTGVTTTTGQLLPGVVGASITLNTTAAIYGIVAASTATVTFSETY
jgi:hypothetical protein